MDSTPQDRSSQAANAPSTAASRPAAKKRRKITPSLITGEVLLTVGLLLLSFAFYESYWTNLEAQRAQSQVEQRMEDAWANERVNPRQRVQADLGEAFARMFIPAFGSDYQFAIVEGTSDADLLSGPGHYVDTPMPGERGNFAVAGHRVGKGAPFNDLGSLNTCDAIVVETQKAWTVYRVLPIDAADENQREQMARECLNDEQVERATRGDYAAVQGRHITTPTDVSTLAAIPGTEMHQFKDEPVAEGLESVLTLTTCHPQFSNAERMIIHAMMTEKIDKTPGATPPAALEEA